MPEERKKQQNVKTSTHDITQTQREPRTRVAEMIHLHMKRHRQKLHRRVKHRRGSPQIHQEQMTLAAAASLQGEKKTTKKVKLLQDVIKS